MVVHWRPGRGERAGLRYGATDRLVMAIVNRTRDSFYDGGVTWGLDQALERVRQAVRDGADLVDIGGVKAGEGPDVSVAEEKARVVDLVAAVRAEHPDLLISVDTWRAEVGAAVCAAGADVINDAWGGADPELVDVAAEFDAAIVLTHTGGMAPRSALRPVHYDDVMADVTSGVLALVQRALDAGVDRERLIVDPAHDFGKDTRHSLEVTRRLDELVALGWPVLVALSRKDFVGETLDLPVAERLSGTLAATAICAWHGAMVYRAHDVAETRQVLDLVSSVQGHRPARRLVRGQG